MVAEAIRSPDDPGLALLCQRLAELGPALERSGQWPTEQLFLCRDHGVYEWFFPEEVGGQGWSEVDLVRGQMRIAAACMTTAFILTQWSGACRRIVACENETLRQALVPDLVAGETFATLGISHLTTSRRHLGSPAMRADDNGDAFLLDGYSPWVTGGRHADFVVTGGEMDDGQRILVALPTDLRGVNAEEGAPLVALRGSDTGALRCDKVRVERRWLMAGPAADVMAGARGANTGGLQTSALAVGLAGAAVEFLFAEGEKRSDDARRDILVPAAGLRNEVAAVEKDLLAAAAGEQRCSAGELRARANSVVLRGTQAALAAAKGAGYVVGHPAGRWCREALFFLVWSCPAAVMAANLCELAGISDE